MSKIYEALIRAEQERVDAVNQAPAVQEKAAPSNLQEATVSVRILDEFPMPAEPAMELPSVELPPVDEPFFPAAPASPVAVVAPVATVAQPLDISTIRTTVWSPMLDKLPALEERGSAVEQFRSLRTRLFGFRDLNSLKSILISSGLPREGKSFIATNLAISFARHKASRVLLIDGDMRRSSLHTVFGCSSTPGLTTYLAGHATIPEIMQRAALKDDGSPLFSGLGSLVFIGGGEEGDLAADLSGSGRFRQLIEAASPHFDWIIVDSSPVNLVTDGVNLAAACDAVLMVARGGVTKFEAAQRALAELKSSKILGVVLNAVDTAPMTDGYYGYEGYDSPKTPPGPTTQ
jgi:protein-tyrosine kinase